MAGNTSSTLVANKTSVAPEISRPQSCGVCGVGGPNVDVYYWPQPSANTSCLSIIGPTPSPPLAGATIANGVTYWGYTNTDAPHNVIQTMQLTSINGITFKMPLFDPWPYTGPTTIPTGWTLQEPIGKRAHTTQIPLLLEPRAPFNESRGFSLGNGSFSDGNLTFVESTVVYNGHTMTSPSIYVDFYSLTATDACGILGGGPNGVITSTLIAFAPGELSTFAGPLNEWLFGMQPGLRSDIVPYNFADLPCPPYETMTDQWYKPEPGGPYRPIIAFPSKVLEVDPLWKTCTTAFFTGFDPPIVLHPSTALVPQVTPAADSHPPPVKAKPSQSPEGLPKNTANPSDHQVPPARNTAAPDPAKNDPFQNSGLSNAESGISLGTAKSGVKPKQPMDASSSTSGETEDPSEGEPASPVAKTIPQAQPASDVGINGSPENESSGAENPNRDSDPSSSSGSDPVSTMSPTDEDDPQHPLPIATAGGEPIVAVSQRPSSDESNKSSPDINDGEGLNTPIGNKGDQPNTNPLKNPKMFDPQSADSASTETSVSTDPVSAPAPFTTTIDGHVIQALSLHNAILLDGESVTRGQSSLTVSGTPIVLQQDGDLVLGASTVQNLLPSLHPPRSSLLTDGTKILTLNNYLPNQASYPTLAPQVYHIGTISITAGGPPLTYAGTKIQAISDGAVIVGDVTYRASPTPAAVETAGGADYPVISGASTQENSSSSGAGELSNSTVSESGDAGGTSSASVVTFHGAATRGRARWSLFSGVIIIGMII